MDVINLVWTRSSRKGLIKPLGHLYARVCDQSLVFFQHYVLLPKVDDIARDGAVANGRW